MNHRQRYAMIGAAVVVVLSGCAAFNELDRAAYRVVNELDQAAGRALGIQAPLPLEQRYARLSWATVSVHQADAECLAEVQRNPTMGFPVCMRAKGWEERR